MGDNVGADLIHKPELVKVKIASSGFGHISGKAHKISGASSFAGPMRTLYCFSYLNRSKLAQGV